MPSFHQGPLKNIHDALRAALPPDARTDLPDALGATTPNGRIAREILSFQGTQERLALGALCSDKLKSRGFITRLENREAVKVVLQEVSIFACETAQELGLQFASALNRCDDTWLRIIAGLEVAELLSRLHVYAPASTAAYRQLYESFDAYLRTKSYEKGPKNSLFHPIATACGDQRLARAHAIEAVLHYGEEALRLFWGLQARAMRDGQQGRADHLRGEEVELAAKLCDWAGELTSHHYDSSISWLRSLQSALDTSHRGQGASSVLPPETPRSRAVKMLLEDAQALISRGDYETAERHIAAIRRGLEHAGDLSNSALQDSYLLTGYLKTILAYRTALGANTTCSRHNQSQAMTRALWRDSERLFHEPGTLWSRAVTDQRMAVLNEVPLAWRVTPTEFPI